jgi:hypothetical protein
MKRIGLLALLLGCLSNTPCLAADATPQALQPSTAPPPAGTASQAAPQAPAPSAGTVLPIDKPDESRLIKDDTLDIHPLVFFGTGAEEPVKHYVNLDEKDVPREYKELEERADITEEVFNAFSNNDYKTLEKLEKYYRETKERTVAGSWNLHFFYYALPRTNTCGCYEKDKDNVKLAGLEKQADAWMKAYPQSPAACIYRASLYEDRAWSFRGHTYAQDVPPNKWEYFFKYLELGEETLQKCKSYASIDPEWHVRMFELAKLDQVDTHTLQKMFIEGVNQEPYYSPLYEVALWSLQPKWSGSYEAIEKMANYAAEVTKDKDGYSMYARIYINGMQSNEINHPFRDAKASWPVMKQGFEDLIARYPDYWNMNMYAKFACIAGDKATTRRLIDNINSQIVIPLGPEAKYNFENNPIIVTVRTAWNTDDTFRGQYDNCYAWAHNPFKTDTPARTIPLEIFGIQPPEQWGHAKQATSTTTNQSVQPTTAAQSETQQPAPANPQLTPDQLTNQPQNQPVNSELDTTIPPPTRQDIHVWQGKGNLPPNPFGGR